MDYRIFNVRTFSCVRIHTGVGHTGELSQHFDSEKLSQICIVLPTGFELLIWNPFGSHLEADALLTEPRRPLNHYKCTLFLFITEMSILCVSNLTLSRVVHHRAVPPLPPPPLPPRWQWFVTVTRVQQPSDD